MWKRRARYRQVYRTLLLVLAVILTSTFSESATIPGEGSWVPMAERIKIWDQIVGNVKYTISPNGLEATFSKDGAQWTIVGANAPIVTPTVIPKSWPVKGDGFEVLVIPEPITNEKILPFSEVLNNAVRSDTIHITAAKDEYEPGSFVIRSGKADLKDVMIKVTDLKHEKSGDNWDETNSRISKKNIDVRLVKCWYQAGTAVNDVRHKNLTPELLLHDDDLVRVDYESQVDLIRNMDRIEDSKHLKPFEVPKEQNKQVWITVRVPKAAEEGNYTGRIRVSVSGRVRAAITLKVHVLPFRLPQPYYISSIYYRGTLDPLGKGSISSELKSEEQYEQEMKDLYAHGVTDPTVYQQFDKELLGEALAIRNREGMGGEPLYYLGVPAGDAVTEQQLASLRQRVKEVLEFTKAYGVPKVYFYGKDEAAGSTLTSQRASWEAVRSVGGKIFAASYKKGSFEAMGDIEDLFVRAGPPSAQEAEKWHSKGHKILSYDDPQGGEELPETYRKNYGLLIWENNYDGAMDYAYQHTFGNGWDDFDDLRLRDLNFTYPTENGVIDTVEWEGYREGVDDIRYLTLLLERKTAEEVRKMSFWKEDDAYKLRRDLIQQILKTRNR